MSEEKAKCLDKQQGLLTEQINPTTNPPCRYPRVTVQKSSVKLAKKMNIAGYTCSTPPIRKIAAVVGFAK